MGSSSLEAYKVNYWTGILHTQQDYGCWLHKETNTDDAGGKEMRFFMVVQYFTYSRLGIAGLLHNTIIISVTYQ